MMIYQNKLLPIGDIIIVKTSTGDVKLILEMYLPHSQITGTAAKSNCR